MGGQPRAGDVQRARARDLLARSVVRTEGAGKKPAPSHYYPRDYPLVDATLRSPGRQLMSSPILKLVVQRIAMGVVLLFAVSILIFVGTQILPGDVAQSILGQSATPQSL